MSFAICIEPSMFSVFLKIVDDLAPKFQAEKAQMQMLFALGCLSHVSFSNI